jgi:hypothetical protein
MAIHEISTLALSSATILAFPATIVAEKVERMRRVENTREWLQSGTSSGFAAFAKTMPEWLLNQIGELRASLVRDAA